MSQTSGASDRTRALVLGGGGPVGVAWELGLAAGLGAGGVDLKLADQVVGTSAGSIAGALLTSGGDLAQLAADVEAMFSTGVGTSGVDQVSVEGLAAFMELMFGSVDAEGDGSAHRQKVGTFALEATTVPEESFVDSIGTVLKDLPWPSAFSCTAVDAATGQFQVWNESSDVPLERAVASSCAVPGIYPPITIGQARYMDGGVRSPLNVDQASGADVAVVVSVMAMELPPGFDDPRIGAFLDEQRATIEALRDSGTTVEVIAPDLEFLTISGFGMSLMDFSIVGAAAEAGTRLGKLEADRLAAIW
jgi:NTE family protein